MNTGTCKIQFDNWLKSMAQLSTSKPFQASQLVVFVLFSAISVNVTYNFGASGLVQYYIEQIRKLPFVNSIIKTVLQGEVKGAVKMLTGVDRDKTVAPPLIPIPERGIAPEDLMKVLHNIHSKETAVEEGKAFAYSYTTIKDMSKLAQLMSEGYRQYTDKSFSSMEEMDKLLGDTWEMYMHTNALNPMVSYLYVLWVSICVVAIYMCCFDIMCKICMFYIYIYNYYYLYTYRFTLVCVKWKLK